MEKVKLGRTNLMVSRTSFGALPIQRILFAEADVILRKAYDNGINLFDTARMYSDSEEKIGSALADVRNEILIATKSMATDKKTLLEHLATSLRNLKTDHVDILQLHNPKALPDPNDPDSAYAGLLEARQMGWVRFLGLTNHSLTTALAAADSGLYDTIQFPLNSLVSDQELELVHRCKANNLGVIAMKGLSGGLITNVASSFAFLRQFDNVVPIWGVQRLSELDEFLALEQNPPLLDAAMWAAIKKDREELAGDFCRGCGYCLPCPAGIDIPMQARMAMLLRRAPPKPFMTAEYRAKMDLINDCQNCGHCKDNCPYGLDTPELLRRMLKDYNDFYEAYDHK